MPVLCRYDDTKTADSNVFTENALEDNGAMLLASVLDTMPRLTWLDLNRTHVQWNQQDPQSSQARWYAIGNGINDEGICAISEAVPRMPRLRTLLLHGTHPIWGDNTGKWN